MGYSAGGVPHKVVSVWIAQIRVLEVSGEHARALEQAQLLRDDVLQQIAESRDLTRARALARKALTVRAIESRLRLRR